MHIQYLGPMKSLFNCLICAAILAMNGCGKNEPAAAGGGGSPKSYRVAVIPKGTTHEFWNSIHAGAVKAEQEIKGRGVNLEVIWKGPLREDDRDQQIQVVENFASKRVSGIVLAPLDSQALVNPVSSAVQAGIPTSTCPLWPRTTIKVARWVGNISGNSSAARAM